MADMDVDIVAVEREIWSGKGTFVFTRTTSGEIGILPRHIPLVAHSSMTRWCALNEKARTIYGSPSTAASCP